MRTKYNSYLLLLAVIILLLAGCNSNESSAIDLVQNSPVSYGNVYYTIQDLDATSTTIQAMPSYKEAANQLMKNTTWETFEGQDGRTYVNLAGHMGFLGFQSDILIQWVIKGDLESDNAVPYFNAIEIDGVPKDEGMFDALNCTMLYDLNVINEEQLAMLAMLLAIGSLF